MKRFMSGIFATALAAAMTVTSLIPVEAAPVVSRPLTANADSNVVQVQNRILRRGVRSDRRDFRRGVRNDRRGYYNGYRGHRDYRRGYRRSGNYWFPAAAFITGAIVGGAINNSAPAVRSGGSHTEWCYSRYRSYRASDNTYQPNSGPRRQCNSPY